MEVIVSNNDENEGENFSSTPLLYDTLPDKVAGDILSKMENKFPAVIRIKDLSVYLPLTFSQRLANFMLKVRGKKGKEEEEERGGQILYSINAVIPPGKLVAILGTSGSGKTTLLNTLSARIKDGDSTGISLSGSSSISISKSSYDSYFSSPSKKKKGTISSSLLGYVLQHDHLLPNLTAYETLLYAGLVRLPNTLSYKEKKKIVNKVIIELGLADCAGTRVGGDGKHPSLSGGERRRVSIGIQMLTDPSLIFFDEPTTGLDSFTSNKLMRTLWNIAHNRGNESNRSIICTIHQPRADIFHMIDLVLLLSKGRVVYFGEGGDHILNYFAKCGYPCPDDMNPADFFLDLITVDTREEGEEERSSDRLRILIENFQSYSNNTNININNINNNNNNNNNNNIEERRKSNYNDYLSDPDSHSHLLSPDDKEGNVNSNFNSNFPSNFPTNFSSNFSSKFSSFPNPENENEEKVVMKVGNKKELKEGGGAQEIFHIMRIHWLMQIFILTKKLGMNTYRDRSALIGRFLQGILMGFSVGFIFYQLNYSPTDLRARVGSIYLSASLEPYIVLLLALIQCSGELKVFDREYSDGMVDVFPYYIASMISSAPLAILSPFTYCIPFYYLVGLRSGFGYFFWFYLILSTVQYAMEAAGHVCAAILREFGPSSLMANSIVSVWNLACGFLINPATFPIYVKWLSYTSPYLFGFAALAINEFEDNVFCDDPICHEFDGNYVLEGLNLVISSKLYNFLICVFMAFAFRCLSFLILKFYVQPPK